MSNVCTRCGKERIITSEWFEGLQTELRSSTVHHIKTSCPDPECQKKVDQDIKKEKQKNEARRIEKIEAERVLKEEREKRMEQTLHRANKRK